MKGNHHDAGLPYDLSARVDATAPLFNWLHGGAEYAVDAAQRRSILFWDVMRQRGYREHIAETAPHVLDFKAELVVDGRLLLRPVNYCLTRIVPSPGIEIDLTRRPFVRAFAQAWARAGTR